MRTPLEILNDLRHTTEWSKPNMKYDETMRLIDELEIVLSTPQQVEAPVIETPVVIESTVVESPVEKTEVVEETPKKKISKKKTE